MTPIVHPHRRGSPTLFAKLTVAAAEAANGLAVLVCFFRSRGMIGVENVTVMEG